MLHRRIQHKRRYPQNTARYTKRVKISLKKSETSSPVQTDIGNKSSAESTSLTVSSTTSKKPVKLIKTHEADSASKKRYDIIDQFEIFPSELITLIESYIPSVESFRKAPLIALQAIIPQLEKSDLSFDNRLKNDLTDMRLKLQQSRNRISFLEEDLFRERQREIAQSDACTEKENQLKLQHQKETIKKLEESSGDMSVLLQLAAFANLSSEVFLWLIRMFDPNKCEFKLSYIRNTNKCVCSKQNFTDKVNICRLTVKLENKLLLDTSCFHIMSGRRCDLNYHTSCLQRGRLICHKDFLSRDDDYNYDEKFGNLSFNHNDISTKYGKLKQKRETEDEYLQFICMETLFSLSRFRVYESERNTFEDGVSRINKYVREIMTEINKK